MESWVGVLSQAVHGEACIMESGVHVFLEQFSAQTASSGPEVLAPRGNVAAVGGVRCTRTTSRSGSSSARRSVRDMAISGVAPR